MPRRSFQHEIPRRVGRRHTDGTEGALPDEGERFKFSGFTRKIESPRRSLI
jgi:hypothetical protein